MLHITGETGRIFGPYQFIAGIYVEVLKKGKKTLSQAHYLQYGSLTD
jgi:hypothetical protein